MVRVPVGCFYLPSFIDQFRSTKGGEGAGGGGARGGVWKRGCDSVF